MQFNVAWGAHHSSKRRIGQGERGEELLPVGERQSEHFLGHHQTTTRRNKGCCKEQGQGDWGCWREASSRNQGWDWYLASYCSNSLTVKGLQAEGEALTLWAPKQHHRVKTRR